MKFRFLNAGESHGKKLTAIIENVPANFDIDVKEINKDLARRQKGYGRGPRMKIEHDKAEITSGIRFGKTIGSPITLEIVNKDFKNWQIPMSIEPLPDDVKDVDLKEVTCVRPGHADFAGALKYNQTDIRNILERSSARETATKVAVGAIAKQILKKFNIKVESSVISIGQVVATNFDGKKKNDLNCPDDVAYKKMIKEIDKAYGRSVSLGGLIMLEISNVPAGLGSHTHWDRRLDGLLAQALMSIQAVKSVEVGLGKDSAFLTGDKLQDEFFIRKGKVIRKTNNAGGIEGGMSNGEHIILTIAMKPIPTMDAPLNAIDIKTMTEHRAHYERSDVCAVPACGVIAEAMCAIVILQQFLEKFGGDSYEEVVKNVNNYLTLRK
ncbi:MAG: chorismate synthase [Candidatus Gastranaerophilales bacterium]|nr:chorismate synthase [Candidatus Gastranaerophilales bacterium]